MRASKEQAIEKITCMEDAVNFAIGFVQDNLDHLRSLECDITIVEGEDCNVCKNIGRSKAFPYFNIGLLRLTVDRYKQIDNSYSLSNSYSLLSFDRGLLNIPVDLSALNNTGQSGSVISFTQGVNSYLVREAAQTKAGLSSSAVFYDKGQNSRPKFFDINDVGSSQAFGLQFTIGELEK